MTKKQGSEDTEFVKDGNGEKDKYIFQENEKTKSGATIVIIFLVVLVIGVIVSMVFFGMPSL